MDASGRPAGCGCSAQRFHTSPHPVRTAAFRGGLTTPISEPRKRSKSKIAQGHSNAGLSDSGVSAFVHLYPVLSLMEIKTSKWGRLVSSCLCIHLRVAPKIPTSPQKLRASKTQLSSLECGRDDVSPPWVSPCGGV